MANPWNNRQSYDYSASWIAAESYCRRINERFTGDPDTHWLEYSIKKFLLCGDTESKSVLILGANEGWMEAAISKAGFKGKIIASDIADKALARAKAKTESLSIQNVEYVHADLNSHKFAECSFDFVIAEGVLHHIENIDFCIDVLRRCLKPGGLLIGSEFIGAFRFQFPAMQVRWINSILAAIPTRYRPMDVVSDQNLPPSLEDSARVYYVPPSLEAMIAFDPSEAISGHLLLPTIERHFLPLEKQYGGGAIVMNITGHFPFDQCNSNPECDAWLGIIADIEQLLYEQNIVPSDLVYFVYRRE